MWTFGMYNNSAIMANKRFFKKKITFGLKNCYTGAIVYNSDSGEIGVWVYAV
jgi:hypothetical protein